MGECDVSADVNAFRAINGGTIGFSDLDLSVGGLTVFNSLNQTATPPVTIATAVSNLLAGDATGLVLAGLLGVPIPGGSCDSGDVASNTFCNPLVPLSIDPFDGPALTVGEAVAAGLTPTPIDGAVLYASGLQAQLSDEQQALLGCGPFYRIFCDGVGIALVNAEAGTLFQSLLGFEGIPIPELGNPGSDGAFNTADDVTLLATNPFQTQPGTVGFQGAPICTRYENGQMSVLPGCRGAGPDGLPGTPDDDAGYNMAQDGTTTGPGPIDPAYRRFQPFTSSVATVPELQSQFFISEMAVLSWNAAMTFAALSAPPYMIDTNGDDIPDFNTDVNGDGWPDSDFIGQDEFDITRPFRADGCSFAAPYACGSIQAFGAVLTRELDDDPSGPPQRRWVWETGAEYVQTDLATDDLEGFATWTFHALGPEVSRRDTSDEAGVLFVLGPPDEIVEPPDSPLVVRGPGADGLPGTADDPFVGVVYGVVPEPSQALLYVAALLAAVGLARSRRRL
jgi:hypothetical protein